MQKVIFLAGPARSGTTMMDVMLGHNPSGERMEAFSAGEVGFYFRPTRTHHFEIRCFCNNDVCAYWEKLKKVHAKEFHKVALSELDVQFLIDSTKDPLWIYDSYRWARRRGLDVEIILMMKDPINMAYSHWKRNRDVSKWKREFVGYYNEFLKTGLPFFVVDLQQLTENPSKKLSHVCSRTGIDYWEGKEHFWNAETHHLFGSAGVRRQIYTRTPGIKHEQEFPLEFRKIIPEIEKDLAADEKVKEILTLLRRFEVEHSDKPHHQQAPSVAARCSFSAKRLKRRIRGIYPEYWPTDQEVLDGKKVPNDG